MIRLARLLMACALGLLVAPAAMAQPATEAAAPVASTVDPPAPAPRRILVMLDMAPEHYRPSSDYGAAGGYGDAAALAARHRLAERLARDQGLVLIDSWPMPVLGIDCVEMEVPGDEPLEAAAERISHQRGVAWAQPVNAFQTQGAAAPIPNDRMFAAQPAAHSWRLAELQRMATGRGVKVAIVDSLIDAAHPDLRGRLMQNRNLIGGTPAPELHGTAIAGVIGARANNLVGIAGIAPDAELIGLRACWQRTLTSTLCDSLSLARALTAALDAGAQVINLSLSGPRDLLITRLVEVALSRGTSVVAAIDPATGTGFPAAIPGVFAVAGQGMTSLLPGVYTAPGRDVPTTGPGGGWFLASGNSYAAAHVSGLLALERQLTHGRSAQLVSAGRGGGEIDAYRSLAAAGAAPRR